ncbi:MAG: DUF4270 family protein [Bacteroidales bacterium]|nr:DUF4270 family protein [Bacteroidales bacterium]
MKTRFLVLAAASLCCLSCVETNSRLGGGLVPVTETYTFHTVEVPLEGISMQMADNLSGYSNTRLTIGSIREPEFGLTTRSSAVTLVPLISGDFDLGANPVFKRFHFAMSRDTTYAIEPSQENVLRRVRVYEVSEPLDPSVDYDTNRPIPHGSESLVKGTPIVNGTDSLSFDFTPEFGRRFLQLTAEDVKDMKAYLKKFPGIYLETEEPDGDGGRIDMFNVQMAFNKNTYAIGNCAVLDYSAEFKGVRRDTTLLFYYGATDFFDLDSLFEAYSGYFPQYALNYTGQQTRDRAGDAGDRIWVEGGGGLKPVVSARSLRSQVEQAISQVGGDPREAIINKASLIFPFDLPENVEELDRWPYRLSPTCRFVSKNEEDGTTATTYMGLTDATSSSENQGDVDRSLLRYAPDITYHMQEILKIDETATDRQQTKNFLAGNYDIWLLVNAQEVKTTVQSASREQQEMMSYLAYSSYYNSMYGGYGGYGGYGYGGYGGYGSYGSYYNNYLTMSAILQQMSQAQTSTSMVIKLDVDRFYCSPLRGPQAGGKVPTLRLTFALPNKE